MSSEDRTDMSGGAGRPGVVLPLLRAGSEYAVWAPAFVNYTMQRGLHEVLEKEIKEWKALSALVKQWDVESEASVIASVLAAAAGKPTTPVVSTSSTHPLRLLWPM